MLDPNYLSELPEEILKLFAQVEIEILADMARRISKYDYWISSVEYQKQKLRETGVLQADILKALSAMTRKSEAELRRMMQEAGSVSLASDGAVYESAGMTVPSVKDSAPLKAILNSGYRSTAQTMQNICRTTAKTATQQFENVLDNAWLKVHSGAFSAETAIETAVKELSEKGLQAIRYPSGRTDSLEVAVRRAVVTGVNQTSAQLQEELADELECDLVEVSAHSGARPEHAAWQGRIFSRSGTHPKYPDFRSSTGYGRVDGLCGVNCRHTFGPFIEGGVPVWTEEKLKELEEPKYEYGGKQLTEYEASQVQRYNERQIRRWQREYAAMEAAGLDTSEAAAKLRHWQGVQADFVSKTGLVRQYEREQISPIVTGRNKYIGIDTPKISSSENRNRNYLEKLRTKNVRLRRKQKNIIAKIPSRGDWAFFKEENVEMFDLAALTCATKDEFALFAGDGTAIVIHGTNAMWNIPEEAWQEIKARRLVWVGHSHPTTVDIRASADDRKTLRTYFTWQTKSAIIDMRGNVYEYTGDPQDEINELLGVK